MGCPESAPGPQRREVITFSSELAVLRRQSRNTRPAAFSARHGGRARCEFMLVSAFDQSEGT